MFLPCLWWFALCNILCSKCFACLSGKKCYVLFTIIHKINLQHQGTHNASTMYSTWLCIISMTNYIIFNVKTQKKNQRLCINLIWNICHYFYWRYCQNNFHILFSIQHYLIVTCLSKSYPLRIGSTFNGFHNDKNMWW